MTRRSRAATLVAVLVALVLCGGVAAASWATSGTGTTRGKAGTLAQPTSISTAARTCNSSKTVSQTWSWPDLTGETGYAADVATDAQFSNIIVSGNNTTPKATFTYPNYTSTNTVYFRTRAFNNNWVGAYSATVTTTIASC